LELPDQKLMVFCQFHSFSSIQHLKYKQYKKQLEFIRQKGYEEFLKRANKWNGPHGKLEI
jgi:hypothetical protein